MVPGAHWHGKRGAPPTGRRLETCGRGSAGYSLRPVLGVFGKTREKKLAPSQPEGGGAVGPRRREAVAGGAGTGATGHRAGRGARMALMGLGWTGWVGWVCVPCSPRPLKRKANVGIIVGWTQKASYFALLALVRQNLRLPLLISRHPGSPGCQVGSFSWHNICLCAWLCLKRSVFW